MLTSYVFAKEWLAGVIPLGRDALHAHLGLLVFFGLALAIRSPKRFVFAFVGLAAVALLNEVGDVLYGYWAGRGMNVSLDNGMDVLNTLAWPAVFLAFGPRLLRPRLQAERETG